MKFIIEKGRIGDHTNVRFPKGTVRCISHGDLHSRNILVTVAKSDNPRPCLIDPARRQPLHWASDPARLAADLWVSCIDEAEDVFWDSLTLWTKSVRQWRDNREADEALTSRNKAVWVALKWLRDNSLRAFEIHPELLRPRWQFDLAFALELLHLATYDSISMPKRVLALYAAADTLAELEKTIPWLPV